MVSNLSKTYNYALCALFTAFIAICSQIAIHIGDIPISLSMLAIYITGMVLGAKYGVISVIVYILLGAVGIPVFAGGKGGAAVILGPTGGFIIGYIFCVMIVGWFNGKKEKNKIYSIISMILGLISCYVLGMGWYSIISEVPIKLALKYCVIPFIPGDIIKIIIAVIVYDIIHKRVLGRFINH